MNVYQNKDFRFGCPPPVCPPACCPPPCPCPGPEPCTVSIVPVPGPTGATGPTGPIGPTGPTGTAPAPQALYAVAPAAQTPASASSSLTFPTNQMVLGTEITHTAGSGDFILTQPGSYEVHYTVNAASSDAPTLASVQLNANGTLVPGSLATNSIATSGNPVLLANTTALTIPGTTTLTLVTNTANTTFTNGSILIHKLS